MSFENTTRRSELTSAPTPHRKWRDRIDDMAGRSPALFALVVFALIILAVTALLLLPGARRGAGSASVMEALFTATSAVCVTGLTIVDTATFWSPLGQTFIAIGMQIGGLGVMTIASVLGLAVSRHIGLTQRILTASETKSQLGEVGGLLRAVVITSASVEMLLTIVFLPTFLQRHLGLIEACAQSLFMAISTFNNGGFVAVPEGLHGYAGNWGLCIPLVLGTIIGAVGFPVILNVASHWRRPRKWSLHAKLTLITYVLLLLLGTLGILLLEWANTATIGEADVGSKLLVALTHSTTARSSGLSTIDIGAMNESTWWLLDGLMFVGGGSASTGGGIKVSTFAVLILAIIAEARGDRDAEAFGKRVGASVIRLAISATFLGAALVGLSTLIILHTSTFPLSQVLFETVSAFGTCGLSTGITAQLSPLGQGVIIVLMYLGRVGTMTFAAALALRHRRRVVRLPQERPIIG
ncbi:MAG: TrkH family potassium uptake protein [Arcanobacterium sp.]|nr:TrkH family potassium uptake protein [Arcanobacterium sp.]